MTGKWSSSTLSFFRLPTNLLAKTQINRSPQSHPPMFVSSKAKFDPDVIVQGHGAKKEKQMSSGTLFFLLVNQSIFRKGTQTNCIYRS